MNGRNYNERWVYFINSLLDRHNINKLAILMNVPWQTLRHWLEGHSTFPVTQIAPLCTAIKREGVYPEDAKYIADFVLEGTDMMAVSRRQAGAGRGVLEEALDVAAGAGGAVVAVQEAMMDGVIVPGEAETIKKKIDNEHRELEELERSVKAAREEAGNGKASHG